MEGTDERIVARACRELMALIARWMLSAAAVLVMVLTSVLAVRSTATRFAPLSPGIYVLTIICCAALADLWRLAARYNPILPANWMVTGDLAASLTLAGLMVVLSAPGTAVGARTTAVVVLLIHEIVWYSVSYRQQMRAFAFACRRPQYWPQLWSRWLRGTRSMAAVPHDLTVSQRITRWTEDSFECVLAEFHCHFEAQQRQQPLHVVFCPPLGHIPEVVAEQLSGPTATIKLVQCFTYGARLDVRLNHALTHDCTVAVRIRVRSPMSGRPAAA